MLAEAPLFRQQGRALQEEAGDVEDREPGHDSRANRRNEFACIETPTYFVLEREHRVEHVPLLLRGLGARAGVPSQVA